MMENNRPSINEMVEGKDKPKVDRRSWVGFVEGEVINFMTFHEIEKMTLEDGMGNKAKLTKLKDNAIRVDCTSSNVI